MGDDAVRIVREALAGAAVGDAEAVIPHIHPEFAMRTPPGLAAEPDLYQGPEGVRRWFDSFYEVMDEIRVEATELEPVGEDEVLASLRLSARGRATGIEVDLEAAALVAVVDAKVREIRFFPERAEALAAVGRQ